LITLEITFTQAHIW